MNKITDKLDLLLIEDNPGDVRIIRELLRDLLEFKLFTVSCLVAAIDFMDKKKTDIVLLDPGLPDSMGLDSVKKVISKFPLKPVIVLTGFNDNELAIESIKVGAQDYLFKDKIDPDLLQRSIHYSIERKHLEVAFRESEANLKAVTENTNDRIWSVDRQFRLITSNTMFQTHCQKYFRRRIYKGENMTAGMPPESQTEWTNYFTRALNGKRFSIEKEWNLFGEIRYIDYTFNPMVSYEGNITGIVVSGRDITERKQAEEKLREAHELYQNLFDNTGTATIIINKYGTVVMANEECYGVTGYKADEIIGTKWTKYTAPESLELMVKYFKSRFEKSDEGPRRYETRLVNSKGEVRDIILNIGLIPNSELIIVSIIDITERKQAEKELMQSEYRYRSIIETAPDVIYTLDGDSGRITSLNPVFESVTGWPCDKVIGKTFEFLVHPEDLQLATNTFEQVLKGEYPPSYELRILTKSGEYFIGEFTSLPHFEHGKIIGEFGFARNITERKRAEEALRENEKRLRDIIFSMGDWVWEVDDKGVYTYSSQKGHDLFGSSREDIIGKTQFDFMPPDERKRVAAIFFEIATNKFPIKDLENWNIRKNGERICLLTNGVPILDEEGNLKGYRGVDKDITERIQIQEEIKKLNEELEQRVIERTAQLQAINKELEAFSYSVSHDLRAPLRAIDGYTHILFEDYETKLDDEGKRLCSVIRENSRRMGQLIDDLLSFSRLSRVDINISRIDMKELAGSVYNELTNPENSQQIDFQLGELDSVSGDINLLRQVWTNLISNAIKFSSHREQPMIKISCKRKKNIVVYRITDNGAGFDMKYIDKLFGVFQRLHSVKDFEGTGVGLAIVQHIIIRHGGQVWAEGEVDKGATFYFSLPI